MTVNYYLKKGLFYGVMSCLSCGVMVVFIELLYPFLSLLTQVNPSIAPLMFTFVILLNYVIVATFVSIFSEPIDKLIFKRLYELRDHYDKLFDNLDLILSEGLQTQKEHFEKAIGDTISSQNVTVHYDQKEASHDG